MMISAVPNWEDKVICWNAGSTLWTFVQKNQSTVSPPFLERLPFQFSSIPVILSVSKKLQT